ncbi:MAG TPA: IS4 family transposase [Umezawaea sp.]|nr:IS4 family transposase [Umezawaea sp.]
MSKVLSKSLRPSNAIAIGALTSVVKRQTIERVLERHPREKARMRKLPDIAVVYFVVAMALFFGDGYREVVRKMMESLRTASFWKGIWSVPTASALCQARKRVPDTVMKEVFDETAVLLGKPTTPGCWLGNRRLMAFDGTILNLPDSSENEAEFGRRKGKKDGPFPQILVVGLVEVGTHAVIAAELGSAFAGERALALELRGHLGPDMLVMCDRGFYSFEFFRDMMQTGADLLFRVQAGMKLPVVKQLRDGSYLSEISTDKLRRKAVRYPSDVADIRDATAIPVRVIEYMVTDRGKDGERETVCLITTILDPDDATADDLARTYAERWEIEHVFDEIKNHLLIPRATLRSCTPSFVRQEIWGILLAHYSLRALMVDAACRDQCDPDRVSFTHAVKVVKRTTMSMAHFSPEGTEDSSRRGSCGDHGGPSCCATESHLSASGETDSV